ncbi:type II and III secretion system protein [Azospirillum oryzae]|uniref:Type II and III secretion system protein n=1 Tax=Azospirillum oryzae TaxID=286727 RepID=A0A1X7ET01_9PROT|nr:hypothetical protein [Azospirillum oryzae]SMF39654.1 type II and III secretion system protein [Azospirillum oryzae]
MKRFRWVLVATAAAVAVGCSPVTDANRPSFELPTRPPDPSVPGAEERLDSRLTKDEPVLTVPVPAGAFRPRRSGGLEALPAKRMPALMLSGAPLGAALQTALEGSGVGLVFTGDELASSPVTVALPAGPVAEQVMALCTAGRAWCSASADGRRVEVSQHATFVVELPPVPATVTNGGGRSSGSDTGSSGSAGGSGGAGSPRSMGTVSYAGMEGALKSILGDGNVKVDSAGRTIVYRATLDQAAEAATYFEQVKRNNVLVLMETTIAEVNLNTNNQLGIRWDILQAKIGDGLRVALGGGPAGGLLSPSVSASGIYDGSRLTAGVLLAFLAKEGVVANVQTPELTALSGTPASFTNGGRRRFITQVGFPTSGNTSSSGLTINNVANNTVSTESYTLGMNLTVKPQYYGGVVHADVLLDIVDLQNVENITTGTTVIQNPITSDRYLSSYAMMRPGQALLLAGIRKKRTEGTAEGLPDGDWGVFAPLLAGKAAEQSELVILMRPRVVRFEETGASSAPVMPPMPEPPVEQRRAPGKGEPEKLTPRRTASGRRSATAPDKAASRGEQKRPVQVAEGGRWVDRLPVPAGDLVLAQADGRSSSLAAQPPRTAAGAAAAGPVVAPGVLDPVERVVELGKVEQDRAEHALTVWKNTGGRPVRVRRTEVTSDADTRVKVVSDECSDRDIGPGASCALKIEVVGTRRGVLRASVALQHDTGIGAVNLKGEVVDSAARLSTAGPEPKDLEPGSKELRFASLPAERVVALSNRSDTSLAVAKVRLIGGEQAGMRVVEDGCSELTGLKPGQSCMVVVSYAPPAVTGNVGADLLVVHSGPSRQLVVPVSGQGAGEGEDGANVVNLPPVPESVMYGGASPGGIAPGGGAPAKPAATGGLRLVGVQGARRLVDDGTGTRSVEAGEVMLGGRVWKASVGRNALTLEGGGEKLVLTLGMFGSRKGLGK